MLRIIDLRPKNPAESQLPPGDAERVKERVVRSIKEMCYSASFKHPTGRLADSIRGYVVGNVIYIYSDAPEAEVVEEGVRPHTMWYLLNKTIPIRTFEFGKESLTFRRASLKSYLRGGWKHPGTEGKHVFRDGIQKGLAESEDDLQGFDATVRGQ